MKRINKKYFFTTFAVGFLMFGLNGLEQTVVSVAKATGGSSSYYVPKKANLSDDQLYNSVHLTEDIPNLGPSFTFVIHGVGGDAGNWSNDLIYYPNDPGNASNMGFEGNDDFAWNESGRS